MELDLDLDLDQDYQRHAEHLVQMLLHQTFGWQLRSCFAPPRVVPFQNGDKLYEFHRVQ
jgi:hypothetical protein